MGLLTLLDSRNHRWTQFPPKHSRILLFNFDLRMTYNQKEPRLGIIEKESRATIIEKDFRSIIVEKEKRTVLIFKPDKVNIVNE